MLKLMWQFFSWRNVNQEFEFKDYCTRHVNSYEPHTDYHYFISVYKRTNSTANDVNKSLKHMFCLHFFALEEYVCTGNFKFQHLLY